MKVSIAPATPPLGPLQNPLFPPPSPPLPQISSGRVLSEVEVDLELTGRRKQQQGFLEPSFATIAGANSNGAIIHYRAQEGTCK
jgi:hypothetical protein